MILHFYVQSLSRESREKARGRALSAEMGTADRA